MGGRGSFAAGGNRACQFIQVGEVSGSQGTFKILETNGKTNQHGLPIESNTSIGYIKLRNGRFHELRIFSPDHRVCLEIGYHGEIRLTGDRSKEILHYHTYSYNSKGHMTRSPAIDIKNNKTLFNKYKDYFIGIK